VALAQGVRQARDPLRLPPRSAAAPIECVALVTLNDAWQTQHLAASYRPLSSVMFCSRLLREQLAGTRYFLGGPVATGDFALEVVTLPVSDVDRSKAFYAGPGWRLDADIARGDAFRAVQFRPPHSDCSIAVRKRAHDRRAGLRQAIAARIRATPRSPIPTETNGCSKGGPRSVAGRTRSPGERRDGTRAAATAAGRERARGHPGAFTGASPGSGEIVVRVNAYPRRARACSDRGRV
jgi:catechol 2,3-dioxygenase-like lactoylglutathione lyase family enzyme